MTSTLLADIGGTTHRFALAGPQGRPESIVIQANDDFTGLDAAIADYLKKSGARPRDGVLAVAAPTNGDVIKLTNRAWQFSLKALAAQFGFSRLVAINDFEAIAWALPGLRAEDVHRVGDAGTPAERGARVVCGPGTGLGAAALIPSGDGWQVIATEAGHISFGPASSDEEPVFARLRERAGAISAEMTLSGSGLSRLHDALHSDRPPPETIITRANASDDAARATVALFVRLLGRFAGDLALIFKATGGVYLTGGVAHACGALLDAATFRAAFEAHPPYQSMLARIPVFVITNPQPGLIGCGVYAERFLRSGARSI